MYGQADYRQGSQPPRAPPPYQHGPPQHPPRIPVSQSSHFGAHNVNQNSNNLPPPPPLPHGTVFCQMSYSGVAPPPSVAYGGSVSKPSDLGSAADNEGSQPGVVSSLNGSETADYRPRFEAMEAGNRGEVEELGASNADSDMEMEDDITLTDNNPGTDETLSKAKGTGEEDSINTPQILVERSPMHLNPSGSLGSASTPSLKFHDADVALSGAERPLESPLGTIASGNFKPFDSSLNADTSNAKKDLELIKVANPMRLLQDYASDDSSENDGDLLPKDTRSSLEVDKETKSRNNKIKGKLRSEIFSESNAYHKTGHGFSTSRRDIKTYSRVYIRRAGGGKDTDGENQNSTRDGTSHEGFLEKDILDESGARETSERFSAQKESEEKKVQSEPTSIKVDEFGRLLREARDSDSDSGFSNRNERRKRKYVSRSRSRSRTRSRSPKDRRRKTISRRRDHERSRSRSRSPRKRRSRSRSPKNRRTSQFNAGNFRSNGKRGSECFLFLQGRCLRGASCRYMHREANRSDNSRNCRNTKKQHELRSETKNRDTKKEMKSSPVKQPEHVNHETLVKEIKEGFVDQKNEDIIINLDHSDELVKHQSLGEVKLVVDIHGTSQEKSHPQLFTDTPNFMVNQPQSTPEDRNLVCPASGQVRDPNEFFTPPNQTALTSPKNIPTSDSAPNNMPITSSSQQSLSYGPVTELSSVKVLFPPSYPPPINSREPSQLPPPPPIPISHGANALHMQRMPMGYNPMPHAASYPPQFAHPRNPHPYPPFSVPPNFGWNLPPPPPRPPSDIRFMHSASSQFEPTHFPPRNDFSSHIPARNPEFLHVSRTEPPHLNPQLQNSVPGNLRSQFGEPGLPRDGRFSHHAVQELSTPISLGPVNLHEQPARNSEEVIGNLHQQSSGPSKEVSESSAEAHYSSHTQQAYPPLAEDRLSMPGKTGAGPQCLPDPEEKNNLANGSDFGLPRIIPHHNPYASTFDQPLGSTFGPTFSRGISRNQYDVTSRHVAVNEQGVGDYRYRQTTPSPSAAGDGQNIMPGPCGEQYNPLVDSLEPTSSAKRKDGRSRNWGPASDSYPMECPSSSSNKPMDVHDIARHEVPAEASTTSLDNDEFGETAEGEVGAVDNESLSDLAGVTNAAEIESESKSPGEERSDKKKRKKKKDSRSAKPFKMAIADFVKDVLKPSWRQGNMSKEAFKTIVKKTVDRVSGAMKGHTVPKSQSKIDQYIESSQRKLTKLVMGYVDKYVKV